ncbi:hypothetical protein GCM10023196_036340 [Actinoallomurus vinaceus]|uniref:Uncharacterized protein n=1 Tax=Actinoallomurus vinaceus TaxID=1080074 RepID=A0ABP8UAV3_9ACTN
MSYYARREAAEAADRERQRRIMLAAGHDYDAASRASMVEWLIETADRYDAELGAQCRQIAVKAIAKLRTYGPVGCTCQHQYCIETDADRPRAERVAADVAARWPEYHQPTNKEPQ